MLVRICLWKRIAFTILTATMATAADAEDCCGPGSPFVMGEAYPEKAATCETIGDWIDSAPDTDNRVSLAIRGKLIDVQWDGALAYLLMCDAPGVQVLCVTYSKDGREIGDIVLFGGGYSRAGEKQIMLDPCLASLVD
ncbi:MAG TPA: hypothetical protein VGN97_02980 [Mesorhizobium sp.]|jgi:hypothetical protein|nr:hypothetical protein [Mesorhizobium sp.]